MKEGDEIYVPRYFAHGFITMEEDCIVQYLVDNDYSPENEGIKVWTDYPEIIRKVRKYHEWFVEEFVHIADKDLIEK